MTEHKQQNSKADPLLGIDHDSSTLEKIYRGKQETRYWYSGEYINKKQKLLLHYIRGNDYAGEILDDLGNWELTGEILMEQIKLQEKLVDEELI